MFVADYEDHATVSSMKQIAKKYINDNVLIHLPEKYNEWAFFNPQWKRMTGFRSIKFDDIVKRVIASISSIEVQTDSTEEISTEIPTPKQSVSKFIFVNLLDTQKKDPNHRSKSNAEIEVSQYLEFPIQTDSKINLMDWWNTHKIMFPRLFKKFCEYAPIMASACSVERLFSHGGNTLTAKRNRLDPAVLEELVFLNKNKQF